MVLYSPVPADLVYSGKDRDLVEVPIGNKTIITEFDAQGVCRVVRLISSNPDDYLNPYFQPGREIRYEPVL